MLADPLVWTIRGYQRLVARFLPPVCRFHPSCSRYTVMAVQTHGLWRGSLLAAWRIFRCNPFFEGGLDPVPATGGAPLRTSPAAPLLSGDPRACACTGGHSHDE